MTRQLFLTGAGGFVGGALRKRLAGEDWRLRNLVRGAQSGGADEEMVRGDLLSPESYREKLRDVDAVVHLAALTGKAAPRDYWRVNLEGTRALIAACKEAGVGRFLYVSTIAAGYADQRHYPYAQSKLAAEALVRESGLAFTIIRPTVVLGAESPIWATLKRITALPIIPLPQGARPARVQPVDVDDVARAVDVVLSEWRFEGETLDVGGADPEEFAHFLQAVRRATLGASAPLIRAPLAPIRWMLALAEPILRPLLPVTAGQLALFANDSVVRDNWLMERLRPRMPSLNALLAKLAGPRGGGEASPSPEPEDIAKLERESDVFSRYLTGAAPSADAVRHYIGAAQAHGLARDAAFSKAERNALALARSGPWQVRCADAFCSLLQRRGALRRKLIAFAAVLENQTPTNEIFEAPQAPGPIGAFFQLAGRGFVFAGALIAGMVALTFTNVLRLGRA